MNSLSDDSQASNLQRNGIHNYTLHPKGSSISIGRHIKIEFNWRTRRDAGDPAALKHEHRKRRHWNVLLSSPSKRSVTNTITVRNLYLYELRLSPQRGWLQGKQRREHLERYPMTGFFFPCQSPKCTTPCNQSTVTWQINQKARASFILCCQITGLWMHSKQTSPPEVTKSPPNQMKDGEMTHFEKHRDKKTKTIVRPADISWSYESQKIPGILLRWWCSGSSGNSAAGSGWPMFVSPNDKTVSAKISMYRVYMCVQGIKDAWSNRKTVNRSVQAEIHASFLWQVHVTVRGPSTVDVIEHWDFLSWRIPRRRVPLKDKLKQNWRKVSQCSCKINVNKSWIIYSEP